MRRRARPRRRRRGRGGRCAAAGAKNPAGRLYIGEIWGEKRRIRRPSADDVGSHLLVEFTPTPIETPAEGTPISALAGASWRACSLRTAAPVAANGEVDATCEAALAKGGADFYVVGQLGEPGGVACELQITRSGARLRCTQGALGLLALTGHGDGVRRLPFRTSGGVTLGDGAASVVLPTALLQARLTGADGASAVVQAGSPFVRDLIVSTARKFAM